MRAFADTHTRKRIARYSAFTSEVKGRFVTKRPFDLIGKLGFIADDRANNKTDGRCSGGAYFVIVPPPYGHSSRADMRRRDAAPLIMLLFLYVKVSRSS